MISYLVLTCCNHLAQNSFLKNQNTYGSPNFVLRDGKTSTLQLAKKFEALIDSHLEHFSESLQVNPIPVANVKKNIEEKIQPIFGSKVLKYY